MKSIVAQSFPQQPSAGQQSLFDAETEAAQYHEASRWGWFSLLVHHQDQQTRQSSWMLREMPRVLGMVDPRHDTWLSQAEFARPNRRVVNLARIGLLFVDLDTYRQPWAAGRTPDQLAASALHYCAHEGIPAPSLLIYSGRGLQAKWILDGTLPRQALPRWNAVQRYLVDRLAALGADPAAKDASRVLRLVNTVNTKSGETAFVVHVTEGPDGKPTRYGFEYMAESVLPVARWDVEADRKARAERRQQLKLVPGGKSDNLRGFSGRRLAWDRLEDIRTLAALRGGVHEGERMRHLFRRLNFLLLSGATHSGQMYHEAKALAAELDPQWSHRQAELSTLYHKAKAFAAGEKIEFNGRQYPALYTPKNDTLVNLFQITDDEQLGLATIISEAEARRRNRERLEQRHRAAGMMPRATYEEQREATARQRRQEAQALRAQGLSVREIAGKMGVSVGAAHGYLKPF